MNKNNKLSFVRLYTVVLGLFLSATALAATTGAITVQGTVQAVLSAAIENGADYQFDITPGQPKPSLAVGTITINSNNRAGYELTLTSENSGNIENTTTAELIPYTMDYIGGAEGDKTNVTMGAGGTAVETTSTGGTTNGAVERTLVMHISGNASVGSSAGIYEDNITVTIVAI